MEIEAAQSLRALNCMTAVAAAQGRQARPRASRRAPTIALRPPLSTGRLCAIVAGVKATGRRRDEDVCEGRRRGGQRQETGRRQVDDQQRMRGRRLQQHRGLGGRRGGARGAEGESVGRVERWAVDGARVRLWEKRRERGSGGD